MEKNLEIIILNYLQSISREQKGNLTSTSLLIGNGELDSIAILDLIAFIEREFGIRLSGEDLVPENFETVLSVAKLVQAKR